MLSVTVRVIQKVADEKKANFLPRPYFRLFVMWLMEFSAPDPLLDASNFQVRCNLFGIATWYFRLLLIDTLAYDAGAHCICKCFHATSTIESPWMEVCII